MVIVKKTETGKERTLAELTPNAAIKINFAQSIKTARKKFA